MATFSGFWPALLTPYTADGQINLPMLRQLVEFHLGKGVSGFYLCGSTGEGLFQTVAERKQIAEAVLAQVAGRVPVIVQVGSTALHEAMQLAQHAQAVGAAGISSIVPAVLYDPNGTTSYFEQLAAAAPQLPFLPYLFSSARSAMTLIRELDHIPTLAGSKYTGPNMFELNQLSRFRATEWTIFSGMDEQALPGLLYGAAGIIGSTLNFMPGLYRELLASHQAGDLRRAQELQLRGNRITELLISVGFAGACREVMRLLGFDCGQPRLPNLALPEANRRVLLAELQEHGFADLAAL